MQTYHKVLSKLKFKCLNDLIEIQISWFFKVLSKFYIYNYYSFDSWERWNLFVYCVILLIENAEKKLSITHVV